MALPTGLGSGFCEALVSLNSCFWGVYWRCVDTRRQLPQGFAFSRRTASNDSRVQLPILWFVIMCVVVIHRGCRKSSRGWNHGPVLISPRHRGASNGPVPQGFELAGRYVFEMCEEKIKRNYIYSFSSCVSDIDLARIPRPHGWGTNSDHRSVIANVCCLCPACGSCDGGAQVLAP